MSFSTTPISERKHPHNSSLRLSASDHLPPAIENYSHPWLNIGFFICYVLTAYFYASSMVFDPGFVPKMASVAEQKAVIDELLREWKFDESNFCVTCMIRTPLRSKHCKRCQRCVAKHDQYVPGPPSFRLS